MTSCLSSSLPQPEYMMRFRSSSSEDISLINSFNWFSIEPSLTFSFAGEKASDFRFLNDNSLVITTPTRRGPSTKLITRKRSISSSNERNSDMPYLAEKFVFYLMLVHVSVKNLTSEYYWPVYYSPEDCSCARSTFLINGLSINLSLRSPQYCQYTRTTTAAG